VGKCEIRRVKFSDHEKRIRRLIEKHPKYLLNGILDDYDMYDITEVYVCYQGAELLGYFTLDCKKDIVMNLSIIKNKGGIAFLNAFNHFIEYVLTFVNVIFFECAKGSQGDRLCWMFSSKYKIEEYEDTGNTIIYRGCRREN